MSKKVDLGRIERKTYLAFYQDGLTELLIGVTIATFGLVSFLRTFLVFAVPPLALLLYVAGKRGITYPRIGYVEFSLRPRIALKIPLLVSGFFFWPLDMMIVIWNVYPDTVPTSWLAALNEYFIVVDGVGFAAFFVALALATGIRRIYGYALFTLTMSSVFGLSQITPSLEMLQRLGIIHAALGSVISICGTYLLASFVRRYPVHSGSDTRANPKGR